MLSRWWSLQKFISTGKYCIILVSIANGNCRLFCRLLKNIPQRQSSHWSQAEQGVHEGNSSCKYFSNKDSYFCNKRRNNWLEAKTLRELSCPNLLFPIVICINKCRIFQRKILPLQMEYPIQILLVRFFESFFIVYTCLCTFRYIQCVWWNVCTINMFVMFLIEIC